MSTFQEVLNKLQKLKEKAASAPDFETLEKISGKIDKIRQKLAGKSENRELSAILDKIDFLIAQKNKSFRQKIIKNSSKFINEEPTLNQLADRTLKYSKSAQNLKALTTNRGPDMSIMNGATNKKKIVSSRSRHNINQSSGLDNSNIKIKKQKTFYIHGNKDMQNNEEMSEFLEAQSISQTQPAQRIKRNSKLGTQGIRNTHEAQDDAEKTIISPYKKNYIQEQITQKKRLTNEVDFLQEKLSYSFKQIDDLSKKVLALETNKQKITKELEQRNYLSPMSKNYLVRQESVVDEYSQKLRQKTFIIEDIKAKLEYFRSMNQELKNRVANEQRRSQDYIEGLKQEIKGLKKQVQKFKKQNQSLNRQIQDVEQKNEGLMSEVKKLVAKLEEQSKQSERVKKMMSASVTKKTQQLQKQIGSLTQKASHMSKLQLKLQQQQEQKQQLGSLKLKLQSRVVQLQEECKKVQEQRDCIEMKIYNLQQESKFLKAELKVNIQAKQLLAEQLLQTKDKLQLQSRTAALQEYENGLKIKSKLSKLKQIKGLLNELR